MPSPVRQPPPPGSTTPSSVAYWVVATLAYAGLGVALPPVFLLGFWQSIVFVLVATWLAPRLLRRMRR